MNCYNNKKRVQKNNKFHFRLFESTREFLLPSTLIFWLLVCALHTHISRFYVKLINLIQHLNHIVQNCYVYVTIFHSRSEIRENARCVRVADKYFNAKFIYYIIYHISISFSVESRVKHSVRNFAHSSIIVICVP